MTALTAVLPERAQYISETACSIQRAKTVVQQAGWTLNWIVVIDGPGEVASQYLTDQVVRLPARQGISAARNVGLSKAESHWVFPLDSDDLLDADGLLKLLKTSSNEQNLVWLGANRLLLDGHRTAHWNRDPQRWTPGELATQWSAPFAFHPNSVIVNRNAALSVGGWPAVGVNEDLALVLLLSEIGDGGFDPAVLTHYRVWEKQEISASDYEEKKKIAFCVIQALVNARRALLHRGGIIAPCPGAAHGKHPA